MSYVPEPPTKESFGVRMNKVLDDIAQKHNKTFSKEERERFVDEMWETSEKFVHEMRESRKDRS